jgi:hypothetical protein
MSPAFPFLVKEYMGWIDRDTFEFWMPVQAITLNKASKKDGSDAEGKRWIQGIASTSSRDLQGEIVEQKGIDFSYFTKQGKFNWDHKEGPNNYVGEPTQCKLTKNGLWVKGFLWKNKTRSDEIWEMMNSLATSGSNRKMGFSIQGKVKRRSGNIIKECWLQDIAITACPVNTSTWAEIAKSLSSQTWDLSKSVDEDEEKALSAGNVTVPESLEGKQKEARDLDKALTYEESVAWIQSSTGMSQDAAEATTRAIFSVLTKE